MLDLENINLNLNLNQPQQPRQQQVAPSSSVFSMEDASNNPFAGAALASLAVMGSGSSNHHNNNSIASAYKWTISAESVFTSPELHSSSSSLFQLNSSSNSNTNDASMTDSTISRPRNMLEYSQLLVQQQPPRPSNNNSNFNSSNSNSSSGSGSSTSKSNIMHVPPPPPPPPPSSATTTNLISNNFAVPGQDPIISVSLAAANAAAALEDNVLIPEVSTMTNNNISTKPSIPDNGPPGPRKYRGVLWQKVSKAWIVQCKCNGKATYIGLYNDEEEAARAFDLVMWRNGAKAKSLNFGAPVLDESNPEHVAIMNTRAEILKALEGKTDRKIIQELATSGTRVPVREGKIERGNSSNYRGVSWYAARQIWKASIQVKNKKEYIGRFATEEEAALAYNERAKALRGANATLNVVRNTKTLVPPGWVPPPNQKISRPSEDDDSDSDCGEKAPVRRSKNSKARRSLNDASMGSPSFNCDADSSSLLASDMNSTSDQENTSGLLNYSKHSEQQQQRKHIEEGVNNGVLNNYQTRLDGMDIPQMPPLQELKTDATSTSTFLNPIVRKPKGERKKRSVAASEPIENENGPVVATPIKKSKTHAKEQNNHGGLLLSNGKFGSAFQAPFSAVNTGQLLGNGMGPSFLSPFGLNSPGIGNVRGVPSLQTPFILDTPLPVMQSTSKNGDFARNQSPSTFFAGMFQSPLTPGGELQRYNNTSAVNSPGRV